MTEREIFLWHCCNCGNVVATKEKLLSKPYNRFCSICHSLETYLPVAIDFMKRRFITIDPAPQEAAGREEVVEDNLPKSRR